MKARKLDQGWEHISEKKTKKTQILCSIFSIFHSLFPQHVTLVFDRPSGVTLTRSFKMMCDSALNTHLLLSEVHDAGQ